MFWFGVIVGVIGSWAIREVFLGYTAAPPDFNELGRKNYTIVCAVGEALLPEGGDIPPSYEEARVPQFIDEYLGFVPTTTRRLIKALFFLMEHATYLFAFTTRRFSDLPVEKRVQYLSGWEKSRLYPRRVAFTSLRAIYGMAYVASPDVVKIMGMGITDKCREGLIIERPGT